MQASRCPRFSSLTDSFPGVETVGPLDELDPIHHLLRLVNLPDEYEHRDDFADALRVLVAVGDAGMGNCSGVKLQEIPVLGENDSPKRQGISNLLLIARMQEPDIGRSGDIDATASQTAGNGWMAVLIEVEANRPSHWSSVL